MKRIIPWLSLWILITLIACKSDKKTDLVVLDEYTKNLQIEWVEKLSQVMISDIFTPPVCSRIYVYTNIAAYEALCPAYQEYVSYSNRLKGLGDVPQPEEGKEYYLPIASIVAFSALSKELVYNRDTIVALEEAFIEELENLPISSALKNNSIDYGREVGKFILDWAAKDGYLERNAQPAYIVTNDIARWQPTPPDYMDAMEPNWSTLRQFTLDSVTQFRPVPHTTFDTSRNSQFYKEVMEVKNTVDSLTKEKEDIAWFWDCNPNTSITQGHVTYFQQKLSPAGHWIHISKTLAEKENFDAIKIADLLSKITISMADGFISCWDAKYYYNLTRPETYINRFIDGDWLPIIQSPPFPEYPSGHSVCSGSASEILNHFFGDNYSYTDYAETQFGMSPRSYLSFDNAAEEASISRLYGGIHFRQALDNGLQQGRTIGKSVLQKLVIKE